MQYIVNPLPYPSRDLIILETPHLGQCSAWSGSPNHIIKAGQSYVSRSGQPLEGYADHLGNADDPAYPKYGEDGKQVSGATEADLHDALAWFGHDCQVACYSYQDICDSANLDELEPAVLELACNLGWISEAEEEE
jgi:hypothetical protein